MGKSTTDQKLWWTSETPFLSRALTKIVEGCFPKTLIPTSSYVGVPLFHHGTLTEECNISQIRNKKIQKKFDVCNFPQFQCVRSIPSRVYHMSICIISFLSIFLGFSFSLVYGALLTKTNRISRIFNASRKSAQTPKFISPK